jgi:hypothetical protein
MATQLSTVRVNLQLWNAIEKNTFLHFVDDVFVAEKPLGLQFRRHSEPACSAVPTETSAFLHSDGENLLSEEQLDVQSRRKSEPAQLSKIHFDDHAWNAIQIEKDASLHSGDEDSLADLEQVAEKQLDLSIRCRSDRPQLSTMHSDDQTWNAIQSEKNTFVHFVDEASLVEERLRLHFRRRSDPACCMEFRGMLSSSEMCASTEAPDSAVGSESDMQEFALEVQDNETFGNDVKENGKLSGSKWGSHGKGRPCKGKRIRFKKFAARLQEQINANPCGCDLESIQWPAVLLDDELSRIRIKVLANLREYRNGLLAELSNSGANLPKVRLNLAQSL